MRIASSFRPIRRALALAWFVAGAGAPVHAQPQPQLSRLHAHALMGRWSCRGSDAARAPVTATLDWGLNDAGAFYFNAVPVPLTRAHPRIAETWTYESDGGADVWRAIPDAGTAEQVSFTSSGWSGPTMTWVRMAQGSTMKRTFERLGSNRLAFRQADASGIRFALRCTRTRDDEPR